MLYLEIASSGQSLRHKASKKTLAERFSVPVRDLRPIFNQRQVSTIIRRSEVFIVNFKKVKLIVTKESVLVFNLENPNIEAYFVPELIQKMQTQKETAFSLLVLDATLENIIKTLQEKYKRLEKTTRTLLETIEKNPTGENLTQLLPIKKRLSLLESRGQEIEDLLNEILKEDEDIRDFCFEENDFEEAISIFESSLEQIENTAHEIDQLNENIDDTQEIIALRLAHLRNEIIRFDLIVSVITALLSILAVLVGLYGVNLKNHLEKSEFAFGILALGLFVVFFTGWRMIKRYMRRKKLV